MSNSVIFLLIAVGLSLLGTLVVWLHGRPPRSRSSVDVFNRSLRALATDDVRHEPLSGVTVRPLGELDDPPDDDRFVDDEVVDSAVDAHAGSYEDHAASYDDGVNGNGTSPVAESPAPSRTPRPSPRPKPRPAAPRREGSSRQGADPGA